MIMTDFNAAIDTLLTNIAGDYRAWVGARDNADISRADKFAEELTLNPGRKYMKITNEEVSDDGQRTSSRVWGFVVLGDDMKFKKGDILMAAGYNAPARNKARGNIFDEQYTVSWTGPRYL
jgi:hypothetical protein|tara:strand:+ start:3093 stop:3455 length:363 start_codon:yes stop_codon:yes gene_type:complete